MVIFLGKRRGVAIGKNLVMFKKKKKNQAWQTLPALAIWAKRQGYLSLQLFSLHVCGRRRFMGVFVT